MKTFAWLSSLKDRFYFIGNVAEGSLYYLDSFLEKYNINDSLLGCTALMMACYNGQTLAVKKLLEIPDIDVNFQGRDGRTALIDSVRGSDYRYESVLRMLLSQPDINLDLQDMYHRTALMISIEKGNLRMAYMLIIAGADVAGTVPFVERNLKSAKTEEEREQYQTLLNLVK